MPTSRRHHGVAQGMPEFLRRIGTTKDGRVVFYQSPNGPVLVATGLSVLAFVAGFLNAGAGLWIGRAASIAWMYWSALEITTGVNTFRRLLGGAVLIAVVVNWFR